MKKLLCSAIVAAGCLAFTPAQAQVVSFDDQTVFDASTDAQEVTIPDAATAFMGATDNNCGASQPGSTAISRGDFTESAEIVIGFDSNDMTITQIQPAAPDGLCVFDDTHIRTTSNTNPNVMDGDTIVGNGPDNYRIVFTDPVRVFGLRLLTNNQSNETITFLDDTDTVIDTVDISSLTGDNTREFFGFYSSKPIKTIEIETVGGASQNEGIDRLYVGNNFFEVLYLSDTVDPDDGISIVYRVGLDEVFDLAVMMPIDTVACAAGTAAEGTAGAVPLDHADLLAGTPDGAYLVLINDGGATTTSNGEIIKLNVATGDCTAVLGNVDFDVANTNDADQLAFGPNGVLYIGKNDDDEVRTIDDLTTGATTVVGVLVDASNCPNELNLAGSDWTFDSNGDLWVWINSPGGERGLYRVSKATLDDPSAGSCGNDIEAEFIGPQSSAIAFNFTGWATRFNGVGNVAGSNTGDPDTGPNIVYELDSTDDVDGDVVTPFDMVNQSLLPFDHIFGDMTNGPLAFCGNRTRGYWTTHTDADFKGANREDDRLVTLCEGTPQIVSFGSDLPAMADFPISELKGNSSNLTQLLHQLIAAILNCQNAGDVNDMPTDDDCTRSGILAEAEEELCTVAADASATMPEDVVAAWENATPTSEQNTLTEQLDAWNNQAENEGFCELVEDEEDGENGGPGGPPANSNSRSQRNK